MAYVKNVTFNPPTFTATTVEELKVELQNYLALLTEQLNLALQEIERSAQ